MIYYNGNMPNNHTCTNCGGYSSLSPVKVWVSDFYIDDWEETIFYEGEVIERIPRSGFCLVPEVYDYINICTPCLEREYLGILKEFEQEKQNDISSLFPTISDFSLIKIVGGCLICLIFPWIPFAYSLGFLFWSIIVFLIKSPPTLSDARLILLERLAKLKYTYFISDDAYRKNRQKNGVVRQIHDYEMSRMRK